MINLEKKAFIITGRFFIVWWIIMVTFLYVTWPPTAILALIWFMCGAISSLVFIYEDLMTPKPLERNDYLNWIIWFVSGVVSVLTIISTGLYIYIQNKIKWRI